MYRLDGNTIDSDVNNKADKILNLFMPGQSKPGRGRPIAIEDGSLIGAREHLVWLFEQTWADVGEHLPWIKKPADVLEAVRVWDNPNVATGSHYIAKSLFRSSSIPATQNWLTATRLQLGKLNQAISHGYETQEKCQRDLDTAQRALGDHLSEADKAKVLDQISRRGQKLSLAKTEFDALRKKEQELQEKLRDGEAGFARVEFVRFCRSNRYRLTPLNLANALAGLPYIGWRQSAARCRKHPSTQENGQAIQIFKTIERIARSCVRRSDLIKHAETWLKDRKTKKSLGPTELRNKWYYLRWSIKTVLEAEPRVSSRSLPFAITREYWKRTSRPSNVDALFEEEERIVL
jgi:hypothetical protein